MKKVQVLNSDLDIYAFIEKITQRPNQEDPFFVCDISRLIWLYKNWRRLMPRVDIFYATKCNDYKLLLEVYAAIGTGFDCASKEEIRRILALGVPPEKIIFANPTKLVSHLEYAAEVGVIAMTFDNEEELYKIKKHFPTAELLIRIRCDDKSARYKLGNKFGILPEDALGLLKIAKSLDLNVIGVAFHVGCGCTTYSIYYEAIAAVRKVFDMGEEIGYQFRLVDIGGGYPGASSKPIDEIAYYVNKGLDEYFPDDAIKIVAEPGTYACASAFKLVTQIHSKNIMEHDNKKIRMYYVDVSVFNALCSTLYDEFYNFRTVESNINKEVYPSIIWGPTQDIRDRHSETYNYLPDLKIGDWLILEETGAYTLSVNCGYNGFAIPNVCAVINKEDWLMLTTELAQPLPKAKFSTDPSIKKFLETLNLDSYTFETKYFQ